MSQALLHRTLSAAIVERLRLAILDGTYPAGTQLRQDALADAYQVSRIPVREALFQLEAEGLVRIEPHKGAVVSNFSREEIDDVFDLRTLLEPRLLTACAPHMTMADYDAAAALDAEFAGAVRAGEVARWGELNTRFHLSLYRHAPQPRTLAVVEGLLQVSDRFTRAADDPPQGDEACGDGTPRTARAVPRGQVAAGLQIPRRAHRGSAARPAPAARCSRRLARCRRAENPQARSPA